jgi:hypothetical protein
MKPKKTDTPEPSESITITPPKIKVVQFKIKGTAPYMCQRFSKKMEILGDQMVAKKKGAKKEHSIKDPEKLVDDGTYFLAKGVYGMPASAFRAALIRACSLVNYKMTLAKMSLFIEADGNDMNEGTPLVKFNGKREMSTMTVRLPNKSMDVRIRPIWYQWDANIRVRFDESQFSLTDVYNLFMRVGMQVGIGEGRPASTNSAGLGYGLFEIVNEVK